MLKVRNESVNSLELRCAPPSVNTLKLNFTLSREAPEKARLRHCFIKELTVCPWYSIFWRGVTFQSAESIESYWFI